MKQWHPADGTAHWMRLSLGAGVSVATEDILGIFDMDTATVSQVTKKFLNTAQKNGCVQVVGEELPKSFVVVAKPRVLTPHAHGKNRSKIQVGRLQHRLRCPSLRRPRFADATAIYK